MKNTAFAYSLAPRLAALAGIAGLLLRQRLYVQALDETGLLTAGHPLTYGVWALTFCTVFVLILLARKTEEENRADPFRSNVFAAVGCWLLAAALLYGLTVESTGSVAGLMRVHRVLSVAAAGCLAYTGVCRVKEKVPFWGSSVVITVFFAAHIILRYRPWSSDTQAQNVVFALFGCICLMLYSYYRMAVDAGVSKWRRLLQVGLPGIYLCCTAVPHGEYVPMYLAGALWLLEDLSGYHPAEKEN